MEDPVIQNNSGDEEEDEEVIQPQDSIDKIQKSTQSQLADDVAAVDVDDDDDVDEEEDEAEEVDDNDDENEGPHEHGDDPAKPVKGKV